MLVPAVLGVGAAAILLGLVAIVAANWSAISGAAKLGIDLAVGVALAIFVARSQPGWRREMGVLVYYGFVLASIALIGQVYHLSSPLWQPMLTWSVLTAPLLWMVRSGWSGGLWLAGLAITHGLLLEPAFEFVEGRLGRNTPGTNGAALALVAVAPFPYWLVSRWRGLGGEAGAVGRAFNAFAWCVLFALSLAGASLFYGPMDVDETAFPEVLPAILLWLVAAWTLPRWQTPAERAATTGLRLVFALGAIPALLALSIPHGEWPVLSALGQLALLACAAWVCHLLGSRGGFRLATAAIYLRLLVVYFEVFGSLLSTGLGLISGGALAMLFAWLWSKRIGGPATTAPGEGEIRS